MNQDGTLALDEKPSLPPGRVRVTMHLIGDPTQTAVWQALEKIWAGQRARGHVPRSKEEIDAELAAMREDDEERMVSISR